MLPGDPLEYVGAGGGGVGNFFATGAAPAPAALPSRQFDTSPLTGKRDSDKIGGNTVADIRSALEVYNTGYSEGRGYGYAQDVVTRYGAPDIRAGAASYLQAAGLTFLADAVSPTPTPSPTPNPTPAPSPTPDPTPQRNPFELLLDALPGLFGGAVYNPPLQSQATGYTPVSGDFGASGEATGGGGGIGIWLILGAVGVGAYFLYKRYHG